MLGGSFPGATKSGSLWSSLGLPRAGASGAVWVGVPVGGGLEKAPGGQQATSQLHVFSKIPPAITADLTGGIWKRRRGEV